MQYQNEKKREKVKAEISKMQRQQKREKGRRGEEKKRERERAPSVNVSNHLKERNPTFKEMADVPFQRGPQTTERNDLHYAVPLGKRRVFVLGLNFLF